MLEKRSEKTITALTLAALLAVLALQSQNTMQATIAYGSDESSAEQIDKFGITEIYPTKDGREWYVNMDDPRNDPSFRNLGNVNFAKNSDGSWKVSADQIRMEAWSPENKKWQNVEITEYAKINDGSNDLLQMYSRGGHHSSKDPCLGSAYKARLYGDGTAAWNKEITHPAYAGNRGSLQVTTEPLEERWIGFKAVIYNFVEDGNTYVRLESYIDDDVTDASGNLIVKNNWKLASVYEDKGGWSTRDADFDPSCGKDRDEILTSPGGTATQNIAAFRSDDLTWSFKYLSVREIDSERTQVEPQPEPEEETSTPEEQVPDGNINTIEFDSICNSESPCELVGGQHVRQNEGTTTTISSIDLSLRKLRTYTTTGYVMVMVMKDGQVWAVDTINVSDIEYSFNAVSANFGYAVNVIGNYDISIFHKGSGEIIPMTALDDKPGNYFDSEGEEQETMDLTFTVA